ncbi:C-C motif chemokine 20-like [Leucoraja erinacea]|uniref:C-C motif chemokine 20-like n=1 Tax=Leucoraja erinaceus TaxID=7782 RepID=UPI002455E78F|nr:C-C motif chemokine 20-like [Leucoraja erinacea]
MTRVPATFLLLSAVAAVLWHVSQASEDGRSVNDCCLMTANVPIPIRIVKAYTIQKAGNGCSINAIVFLTKKGKRLCAPPKEKWAIKLMKTLNRKSKKRGKSQQSRRPKN